MTYWAFYMQNQVKQTFEPKYLKKNFFHRIVCVLNYIEKATCLYTLTLLQCTQAILSLYFMLKYFASKRLYWPTLYRAVLVKNILCYVFVEIRRFTTFSPLGGVPHRICANPFWLSSSETGDGLNKPSKRHKLVGNQYFAKVYYQSTVLR